MIWILIAIIVSALHFPLLVFLIAPRRPKEEKVRPFYGRNIAHRGLFSADQTVPENSLAAFSRACESGYGMELDVQLSRDGQVVVFHDDTLNRMCGVNSRVDELSYNELHELSLKKTDQRIPLFSEVLETVAGREPLIVELKTCGKRAELCKKTYDLLNGYEGEYCIESFDPFIVRWFKKNAKQVFRGFLSQPPKHYGDSFKDKITGTLLGRLLFNFFARPEFIAYKIGKKPLSVRLCLALGAVPIAWTSHDPKSEENHDVVIFEHYEPNVRFK
ncbi:MAG: glycerophosphodiester phosphodiesterase [Clostridia bacterium]|nr:glycerophosphodiester phosphodiesterase [Clostridia bacterium]